MLKIKTSGKSFVITQNLWRNPLATPTIRLNVLWSEAFFKSPVRFDTVEIFFKRIISTTVGGSTAYISDDNLRFKFPLGLSLAIGSSQIRNNIGSVRATQFNDAYSGFSNNSSQSIDILPISQVGSITQCMLSEYQSIKLNCYMDFSLNSYFTILTGADLLNDDTESTNTFYDLIMKQYYYDIAASISYGGSTFTDYLTILINGEIL